MYPEKEAVSKETASFLMPKFAPVGLYLQRNAGKKKEKVSLLANETE